MSKLKIAVLVSGSGSNLQALIHAVEDGRINGEIKLVVSDRQGAYALQRAEKHGIAVRCIERKTCNGQNSFHQQLIDCLDEIKPDLIVLAGFLSILSAELVQRYPNKIINIHPSLIPDFCGKGFYGEKVHQAVIASGAKKSGATVHFVDENTDTGPIILQQSLEVLEEDTPQTLAERVLRIEHKLLVEAVGLFSNGRLKLVEGSVKIL